MARADGATGDDDPGDRSSGDTPPPPRARGKAPTLSDADLDAMAEVTADDVEDAAKWWAKVAPAEWRGLIDARPAKR